MSIHRAAAKTDANQPEIVEAIRAEGWYCEIIRRPCDVICWHPVLHVLQWGEIKDGRKKDGTAKQDKRQEEQLKFLAWTSCPIWTTADEALADLRKHYPSDVARPDLVLLARHLRDEFEARWKHQREAV